MDILALYTKSYSGDIERLSVSIESVKKFNKDDIKHYVSVPSKELGLFKDRFGSSIELIADEEIYDIKEQNWKTQQVVKSNFWKLRLCKNYVMMDSDSYFIKQFKVSDFIYDEQTPYTVIHEQKDLFAWSSNNINRLGFNPKSSFADDRKKIMTLFERSGKIYDFGPGPIIWSSKVWESLEMNYLKPNNLTFENLIENVPSEFTWYGEYLLVSKVIDIIPIEPLFKFMHYPQQYSDYKNQGYTEEILSENYFGIVMQSNWNAPYKF